MKLLLFLSTICAGGAERVMTTLANALSSRGHEVILATLDSDSEDFYPIDPQVRRVRLSARVASGNVVRALMNNSRKIAKIRNLIRIETPDTVISFTHRINGPVLLAAFGTGIPVVVSERMDPRKVKGTAAYKLMRRLLYPTAAMVVVQTETERAWFSRFVDRITLIQNPVILDPNSSGGAVSGRECSVVGMGRLEQQKGFDLLIDAFNELHGRFPKWRLQIYGQGSQRSFLETKIAALGTDARIELMGITKKPGEVLSTAGVFVLSSRFEGFPNVLLEAMSTGAPCVAFDCPSGPSDILVDGDSGILVPEISVAALVEALERLIRDKPLQERLGAFAAERVKRYSLDIIVNSWENMLHSMIETIR